MLTVFTPILTALTLDLLCLYLGFLEDITECSFIFPENKVHDIGNSIYNNIIVIATLGEIIKTIKEKLQGNDIIV